MTASPLSYGPFISKEQADLSNIKLHYTGKICQNGHQAARYKQGACAQCVSNRLKAKNAERAANRVEITCSCCGKTRTRSGTAAGQTQTRNSLCRTCAKKAWHAANPESAKRANAGQFKADITDPRHVAIAAGLDRYHGHKCPHGHGTERYTKDGKCVACVAARAAKRGAVWAAKNRGKVNHTAAKRRAVKALATPAWLTEADWAAIAALYEQAAQLTATTGIEHEVDHIIPLQGETVCGFHCPENLRIVTRNENRRKHNKLLLAA
jgi:hypothetical protein